ncbi:unnamed protein product [Prunus armeniaca]
MRRVPNGTLKCALEDKRDMLFRMLHYRSQYRESPFLPFETPEIAWLPLTLVGNRLVTVNARRKSPDYQKPLSEIASDKALTSH